MRKVPTVNTVLWYGDRLYLGDESILHNGAFHLKYSGHDKGLYYLEPSPGTHNKCKECHVYRLCRRNRIRTFYRGVSCNLCELPGHDDVFKSVVSIMEEL